MAQKAEGTGRASSGANKQRCSWLPKPSGPVRRGDASSRSERRTSAKTARHRLERSLGLQLWLQAPAQQKPSPWSMAAGQKRLACAGQPMYRSEPEKGGGVCDEEAG